MRRLLQLGTLLLFIATFLTPISECLDRWDPPGLGNDVEMGVFALAFMLVLVLAVCVLLAARALRLTMRVTACPLARSRHSEEFLACCRLVFAPPGCNSPLRI